MTTPDGARPNFFIILGIDPAEPWDEAAFTTRLSEKRNLWARQSQGIRTHDTTQEAQRNLSYHSEIKRIMRDPREREAERAAAVQQVDDELLRRRDEIVDLLSIRLTKGFLTEEEYEKLRGEEAVQIDDSLREQLESAPRRPSSQAREEDERLDQATQQNLRGYLRMIGQPDLYAALRAVVPDIDEESPAERLLEAADELYRKARNTANKRRPEVGAMQNLAGLASRIFGSPDLRRRHDASMRLRALDVLVDRYESGMEIAQAIDSAQFERFLAEAAAKGIDIDVARGDLIARFRKRGWPVEMPSSSAEARLRAEVRCPRCSRLNDPDAAYCAGCSRALRGPCPRCGAVVTATQRACSACGFPVGERDYVEHLAEQAESRLSRGDVSGADECAAEAGLLWAVPADRCDDLSDRLRAVRARIEERRTMQRGLLDQVHPLMEARRFQAAALLLREAVGTHPDLAGLLAQCEDAIGKSRRRYRDAQAAGLAGERRAELYDEALNLCADNDDARRELSLVPLSPAIPGPVSAQGDPPPDGMGIFLHWVELDWPDPERGKASVVVAGPDGPALREGDELPETALENKRTVPRESRDRWFFAREWLRRYTLVLVMHGRCFVGGTRLYARGPEVADLRAVHEGTSVRVTWTWPTPPADDMEVLEALVTWDGSAEIGDPVNAPDQEHVARVAQAATGGCDIRATGRLFVKVAAVVRHKATGTAYVTSGVRADARRPTITVRYEVKPGLGSKAKLLLTADHLDRLPALVLRGRTDNRPARQGDESTDVHTIEAGAARREVPIRLDKNGRIHPRSCRLFVASEEDGEAVRIIDPP